MDYIYIGKIVNTHGIKGEIKILSNIDHKDLIFKKDFKIYIGKNKIEEVINSYRHHKVFDMITLFGIDDINDVLKYKNQNVYINKNDVKELVFDEDYIGLDVYTDKYIGTVVDVLKNVGQDILVIKKENKKYMVPKVDAFIKQIDFSSKKIYINEIGGLIDEN